MQEEYDFSNARKNPYVKKLKRQITINLDTEAIDYFKYAIIYLPSLPSVLNPLVVPSSSHSSSMVYPSGDECVNSVKVWISQPMLLMMSKICTGRLFTPFSTRKRAAIFTAKAIRGRSGKG